MNSPLFAVQVVFVLAMNVSAQSDLEAISSQEKSDRMPITNASLGSTKNVHQCGNLFFAGQFNQSDIAEIEKQDVARVITLRTDSEIDWDEEAALKTRNIELIKVPFRSPESLTDDVFDKIRELLRDKSRTTLFHCGSANRVGGVWLPFRVLDEGVELEKAIKEAKEIGLRTPFIQEKAIAYIKRIQTPPTMNGETSVKPDINKNFIDPNLDIDTYLEKFEIESREVFLNRERILAECEIEKGDAVADVGAGTGLFTRMFSTTAGNRGWVYAVDISPRFIEHINKEAARHDLQNITGVLCPENSVSLPPDSVDVVFVCDTYHHFEYPKSTLASIHRALKNDGHMIVIDFERIEGKSRDWIMGHVRAGKKVVQAEIQQVGFKLVEEKKMDGFHENYFLKFSKK